jgi:hypothetical protein
MVGSSTIYYTHRYNLVFMAAAVGVPWEWGGRTKTENENLKPYLSK